MNPEDIKAIFGMKNDDGQRQIQKRPVHRFADLGA